MLVKSYGMKKEKYYSKDLEIQEKVFKKEVLKILSVIYKNNVQTKGKAYISK